MYCYVTGYVIMLFPPFEIFIFISNYGTSTSITKNKNNPGWGKIFCSLLFIQLQMCVCVCVMLLYSSLQCRNNQQLWIALFVFSLVKLRRRRFVVVFISFSCLRWLRAKEDKKVVFTMKMIKIKAGLNTVLDKFKFLESGSISILFKIHKLTYPHTKLTEYLLII